MATSVSPVAPRPRQSDSDMQPARAGRARVATILSCPNIKCGELQPVGVRRSLRRGVVELSCARCGTRWTNITLPRRADGLELARVIGLAPACTALGIPSPCVASIEDVQRTYAALSIVLSHAPSSVHVQVES